jgi:hypothetical protein
MSYILIDEDDYTDKIGDLLNVPANTGGVLVWLASRSFWDRFGGKHAAEVGAGDELLDDKSRLIFAGTYKKVGGSQFLGLGLQKCKI